VELIQEEIFSGYSVDDIDKARDFYANVLGLTTETPMGALAIQLPTGTKIFLYPKGEAHQPASSTVLNFPVMDLESAVQELTDKGVTFEQYDSKYIKTEPSGIARGNGYGPDIAWFKDPAGNILSVLHDATEVTA